MSDVPLTHSKRASKRIGFLATGSELTSGEILNTNGQSISQILFAEGAHLGEHLVVDDIQANILAALEFLASRHDALIITGGLGPTSDDRTRFALASFLNLDLAFRPESWDRISKRFELRGRVPTENNKIQALFPENALLLPNLNGTADGAMIEAPAEGQLFFLLPGPPSECLPLFESDVLPILKKRGFTSDHRLYRWKLREVSESVIATKLEPLAQKYCLEIAYRASKPILHVKLRLNPNEPIQGQSIQTLIQELEDVISPHEFEREFPQ
jgi:molybdenum cofactor synthesis domain-containing protein